MANDDLDTVLQDQIAYYRARAGEYDEWFLRQGRYDRGEALNRQWFDEVGALRRALATFAPHGRVLELACGTGLWTQTLAQSADAITAVDSSPEVIDLNRARLNDPRVEYVQADLFNWQPSKQYDVVFFSFWLSHVPQERFEDFWRTVEASLAPGGHVFFIDSRYDATSTAVDHVLGKEEQTQMMRRLNDGREFSIVKVFYQPETLREKLSALGWDVTIGTTGRYFLYGEGKRRES